MKTYTDELTPIDSVTSVFKIADWYEREVQWYCMWVQLSTFWLACEPAYFSFGGKGKQSREKMVGEERENEPAQKSLYLEINPRIDLHLSCQL